MPLEIGMRLPGQLLLRLADADVLAAAGFGVSRVNQVDGLLASGAQVAEC